MGDGAGSVRHREFFLPSERTLGQILRTGRREVFESPDFRGGVPVFEEKAAPVENGPNRVLAVAAAKI
jgi:hypothetical protein